MASQRSHPCHPHSQIFQLPDRNSGFPDSTVLSLDRRHIFGSGMGSALQGTRHWYSVLTLPYPSCYTGILPLPYCCCQSVPQHLQDHYTDRNSLSFHLIEAGMASFGIVHKLYRSLSSTCVSSCGSHQTAQCTSIIVILCFLVLPLVFLTRFPSLS